MAYKNPDKVEAPQKVSAARMKLWQALHEFCRQYGGAVVSVPGHKELRIEVAKDSPLPVKLQEAGWSPHHCGSTTRIDAGSFSVVDVLAVTLPGK